MKIAPLDSAQLLVVDDEGHQHRVFVAATNDARWAFCNGEVWELPTGRPRPRARGPVHEHISAPMPATVRRIPVAVGEQVTAGQTVVVVEAMKMELPLRAAHAGTVSAIKCIEGELVQPGIILVEID